MRRLPLAWGLLSLFAAVLPAASAQELDPARHLFYQADPGSFLEYDVHLYYDWSRTASSDAAALAAVSGGSSGDLPDQPWYAVHDPAEVDVRIRLEIVEVTEQEVRGRLHYGPPRVHFFDSTTQLKLDYARAEDVAKADKRMAQLQDPRQRERFTKVLGVIENPFLDQFWRVLAYSKIENWSVGFRVPRRGGAATLEGFEDGLRERLPAAVPAESRALLNEDARDMLGLVFPVLPDRDQLAKGNWEAEGGVRFRYDGLQRERGQACLRFVNAERKSVARRDDADANVKETRRLEESMLYSKDARLILAHEREVKSAVVEQQRKEKDSVFGSGKTRAQVRWVKTVPAPDAPRKARE